MIPENVMSFLERLAKQADNEQRTSEWSMGNYDDVFSDGYRQAESDIGNEAVRLLEGFKKEKAG